MKKIFKPQIKNYPIANEKLLHIIALLYIIVCTPPSLQDGSATLLLPGLLIFYIISFIAFKWYKKNILSQWDDGGYSKLEIDTDKKLITLDEQLKIPAADILNAELCILPLPTDLIWITQYYWLILNSRLDFRLNNGKIISLSIHIRSQAKKILKLLKECDINYSIDGNIDDIAPYPPNFIKNIIIFAIFCVILAYLYW